MAITATIGKILERQKELTKTFDSEYFFLNLKGRPIIQDSLRDVWERAITKAGLPYRRMYETRHTFASWVLAFGESPE